jgi:plasmid stabilization system protein ParE
MAKVRFSRSAKSDLLSIGAYTLQTWGAAQAEHYLAQLEQCAKLLAGNPSLGRPCVWIRPGLYRFEKGRHVVFHRQQGGGILVSRILHQNMLPDRHSFEEAATNV